MEMLRKLLNTINLKWAQKSRINPMLSIRKGTGTYSYMTIRQGSLYFHAYKQAEILSTSSYVQEVVLEGMTVGDLISTVSGMGYEVDTSETSGMISESALLIVDINGQDITDWYKLYAFTSNWYRVLYPIHRVISQFNGDVDTAIEQLLAPSAKGEWLDYWAGFFKIKRLPDESDTLMLRRIMLTLTSAKSNNIAMEELIGYYIGTRANVLDALPSQIEVRVDPQFMDSAVKVQEIIALLKGAGVDYFLNYQKPYTEDYKVYFRSVRGDSFGTINEKFSLVTITLPVYTEDYQYIPPELQRGFKLNSSNLNGMWRLARSNKKIVESVGMTMTNSSGDVIQQM